MNPVILIPARMKATRLPGKPLADIAGEPMVVRVINGTKKTGLPVYVACSEPEVEQVVKENGGKAVMTEANLPSGTDRIHAALETIDPQKQFDTIINVQGDLAVFDPELISHTLGALQHYDMATAVAEITDNVEINNPNVVKAIIAWKNGSQGQALYFTRVAAPWGEGSHYHHIGIYVYKRESLKRFISLPPSELEKRERLEQLRALEAGMTIGACRMAHVPLSVDTPEDLEKARQFYQEKK